MNDEHEHCGICGDELEEHEVAQNVDTPDPKVCYHCWRDGHGTINEGA